MYRLYIHFFEVLFTKMKINFFFDVPGNLFIYFRQIWLAILLSEIVLQKSVHFIFYIIPLFDLHFFLSRQISELILLSEIVLEINYSFTIFVVKCLIFIGARKWLGFALFKIISAISRIGLILAIDLSY